VIWRILRRLWAALETPPSPTHCDVCGGELQREWNGKLQLAAGYVLACPRCHQHDRLRDSYDDEQE
jgi:hypothetical protein